MTASKENARAHMSTQVADDIRVVVCIEGAESSHCVGETNLIVGMPGISDPLRCRDGRDRGD